MHYSHHAKLTRICIELNIIPKGLKIFQEPSIGLQREHFINKWRDKLEKTELLLLHNLYEKFFEYFAKYNFEIEISVLNYIQHHFKELDVNRFNHRIRTLVKLDP